MGWLTKLCADYDHLNLFGKALVRLYITSLICTAYVWCFLEDLLWTVWSWIKRLGNLLLYPLAIGIYLVGQVIWWAYVVGLIVYGWCKYKRCH